jgi:bifunctional non-homologous end joining protein LigD
MNDDQIVEVGGRRLKLTHLDKVMYPETGTTKGEVISYYANIANVLIPYVRNRPVTRKRWVNGVGTADKPGEVFFQKNLEDGAPDWVQRRPIVHRSGTTEYPLVGDIATLVWLAQLATLEIHVPQWAFNRAGEQRNPDRLVLDLDPGEGAGLAECGEVARLVRPILTDMGLDPYPVTSGSKGIHLYAALDGKATAAQISSVAHELARALESEHKDLIVSDMKKTLRRGKVLVDWSQNNGAKTTIAPYSLRGRPHPMAAAPRTWEEIDDPKLRHLTFEEVLERVHERGDLLQGMRVESTAALEPTPEHLDSFEATPEARDRLAKYRSMRDRSKTPEPIPERQGAAGGNSFVIQEHHARRLHYDFRLEHDGVLVSWAVPKGPPLSTKENHLAVQTEDHPLEYGTFEGRIPKGEYGAGAVTIWDAGTFELEKWRDGAEVIATLHGRPDGGLQGEPRRYALIHTGRGDPNGWLIHLMKPVDATPSDSEGRRAQSSSPRAKSRTRAKKPRPKLPAVVSPMLATAGTLAELSDGQDWVSEMKWDGYRTIVHAGPDGIHLTSRNGKDQTATFPDLVHALGDALRDAVRDGDVVLDGEIVALNTRGRPDFGLLQQRAGLTKDPDVERASRQTPVDLMLFDVLQDGDDLLIDESYEERREVLRRVVSETARVHVPDAFEGDPAGALEESKRLGLEGIVAKVRDSDYSLGRRSRSWIKVKHERAQEVVVIGWRPGNGALNRAVGSLIFAVPRDGELHYAGRVGTGFSERERRELVDRFRSRSRKTAPVPDAPRAETRDANWIRPDLVGEVAFTEWTDSGTLRHPRWRGWRPDKSPDDVRVE